MSAARTAERSEGSGWVPWPVFVPSTFSDMHAERDYLRDVVIPSLQEEVLPFHVRLELVDLPWGVETTHQAEVESKELEVLRVCFDEIDRSRHMLVLLGERRGWVPPVEQALAAVAEKGFETEVAHKSITALEIEYASSRARLGDRISVFVRP